MRTSRIIKPVMQIGLVNKMYSAGKAGLVKQVKYFTG